MHDYGLDRGTAGLCDLKRERERPPNPLGRGKGHRAWGGLWSSEGTHPGASRHPSREGEGPSGLAWVVASKRRPCGATTYESDSSSSSFSSSYSAVFEDEHEDEDDLHRNALREASLPCVAWT